MGRWMRTRRAFSGSIISVGAIVLPATALLLAGMAKLLDAAEFAFFMRYSAGFPYLCSVTLAALLPFAEIVTGAGLLLVRFRRLASFVAVIFFASFLGFHLWRLLSLGPDGGCDCFGSFLSLNGTLMMTLIMVCLGASLSLFHSSQSLSDPESHPSNIRAAPNRLSKNAWILLTVCVGCFLLIRVAGIDADINRGLIMHTDREGSRSRIEDLLQTGYRQNGAHGEPNLFLFLKEPECVSCSRELLFWNQLIAQNARLHVIVVFPGSSAMNGTQVSSLPHFRYPVVRLDENSYEEIMGGSSGVVGRILLAPNGQVMHAEVVGAGDPIATGLMIFLQQ